MLRPLKQREPRSVGALLGSAGNSPFRLDSFGANVAPSSPKVKREFSGKVLAGVFFMPLDILPERQSMPAPRGADIDVGVDLDAGGDLRARPEPGQHFASRFGGVPLGIKRSLSPRAKSLNFFPPWIEQDGPDLRHALAHIQRRVVAGMGAGSEFKNLLSCQSMPIPAAGIRKDGSIYATGMPGRVQLHAFPAKGEEAEGEKGKKKQKPAPYGFAGQKHCGNPLTCFCCAPKVRHKRAQELAQGIEEAIKRNYTAMMITLTAPHNGDMDPGKLIAAIKGAWREFRGRRWWEDEQLRLRLRYAITVIEITMPHPEKGIGNGAHVHLHVLYFSRHAPFTDADAEEIRKRWTWRWRIYLERQGIDIDNMDAFLRHGVDITLPRASGKKRAEKGVGDDTPPDQRAVVDDPEALKLLGSYIADKMAAEISPGIFSKSGKGGNPERVSHFEWMALVLTRYPQLRPYMLRLLRGLRGISWMRWDPGLKAHFGIEEKEDAELMIEEGGIVVREYDTRKEWREINRNKLQRRYIRAMVRDVGDEYDETRAADAVAAADRALDAIWHGKDPYSGDDLDDSDGTYAARRYHEAWEQERAAKRARYKAQGGKPDALAVLDKWVDSTPKTPAGAGVSVVADGRPIGAGPSGHVSGVAVGAPHNRARGPAGCRCPAVSPPVPGCASAPRSRAAMLPLPGLARPG